MFAGPIVFAVFIVTSSFAEESSSNDVAQEKRAPMGFQGMRGKKDLTFSENDEYSKRAPMGFQVNRDQVLKARLFFFTLFLLKENLYDNNASSSQEYSNRLVQIVMHIDF